MDVATWGNSAIVDQADDKLSIFMTPGINGKP